MAKYRVWAKMTSYSFLDVEAESEQEALEIAEDADGGEFITTEDGDWELLPDVKPLDNDGPEL